MVVAMWDEIKGWNSIGVIMLYIMYCIYVYFISSRYLLMFGNDHVRSTREQKILQVDLVRPRDGAGLVLGDFIKDLCFDNFAMF